MIKLPVIKLPVSSIVTKLVMSISGAFLVLFLLFHVSMNIVAVFSAEGYNVICEFLGANWYALAGTVVLAGGVAIHFLMAFYLTLVNMNARGEQRYAVSSAPKSVSWASRNMFVLGSIVILGLALHIYNFWFNMQWVEITMSHEEIAALPIGPADGAGHIAALFASPVYSAIYLVWLTALWFHLTHGIWSMFQTVGWGNKTWYPRLKCAANIVATLVCLGFAAIVVVFFLRSLGCCCCAC